MVGHVYGGDSGAAEVANRMPESYSKRRKVCTG